MEQPKEQPKEQLVNLSDSSWISITTLPSDLQQHYDRQWDALWEMRNGWKESEVITGGVTRKSPRIHASFGAVPPYKGTERSYMFSGANGVCAKGKTQPIPGAFKPLLDYFNKPFADGHYNEVTLNWYDDGSNYTALHRDYMEGMVRGRPIVIITFCPSGNIDQSNLRQFRLIAKDENIPHGDGTLEGAKDGRFNAPVSSDAPKKPSLRYFDNLQIPTYHCQVLRMGGNTQEEFRHGIPQYSEDPSKCAPRLSVTLRAYEVVPDAKVPTKIDWSMTTPLWVAHACCEEGMDYLEKDFPNKSLPDEYWDALVKGCHTKVQFRVYHKLKSRGWTIPRIDGAGFD